MQIEIIPVARQAKCYRTDYNFLNHSVTPNMPFGTNTTYYVRAAAV